MPTADTSSHPGVDFLRAICFSSSIDISVLFIRVLRFHVIAAQQLVATVCPCVSEGVEQPAYIKGSDPQWSLQHRGQSAPPAATSRERDVRSRLGALQR